MTSFSPAAAAAVRWTRETAKPATLDFLAGLEPADETREVALYHASPRDPVWEYVLWPDQAAECIGIQAARVSLVGHSHVALFFVMSEDNLPPEVRARRSTSPMPLAGRRPATAPSCDLSTGRWLLNPGSVGQPRDGDPRAAWLELDTDPWQATYHRVEYDDRPGGRGDRRDRPSGPPGATPLRGPVMPTHGSPGPGDARTRLAAMPPTEAARRPARRSGDGDRRRRLRLERDQGQHPARPGKRAGHATWTRFRAPPRPAIARPPPPAATSSWRPSTRSPSPAGPSSRLR